MDSTEISDVSGEGSIPSSPATCDHSDWNTTFDICNKCLASAKYLVTLGIHFGTEAKGEQPGCLPSEEGSSPSGSAIKLVPCPDCGILHIASKTLCTVCYLIRAGGYIVNHSDMYDKDELIRHIGYFVADAKEQRLSEFPEEAKEYGSE